MFLIEKDVFIVRQIERIVDDEYSDWTIGLKPDPWKHKCQKGHPLTWLQWKAHSPDAAKSIEKFFRDKGMKSTGEKHRFARYVFIFR